MWNGSIQLETRTFSFGPFVLAPDQQVLLKGAERLRIGIRSLEILNTLVERAGQLVQKSELISRVWPDTFVDESNLKVNIAALRRTLGDSQACPRYIATANGRGYRFIAPVESCTPLAQSASEAEPKHNLPPHTARVIGREDTVKALTGLLALRRIITITGTGGIGKTTVALSVAAQMMERFEHGVWFIDLAVLREGGSISRTLAGLLGITLHGDDASEDVVRFLARRRVLIVFDNCEHLIDSVAHLAERIIQYTDQVCILATSREPLRLGSEHVYRLAGLESPLNTDSLTAAEATSYSAIELFIDRAAGWGSYRLTTEDVPLVSGICRKLDGIALAIELVAARVGSLALKELSILVGENLGLLNQGRRTAPARHQTLTAALDWSYELLPEKERRLFRRLAVFTDAFTPTLASAVVGDDTLTQAEIVEGMACLVAKSLVSADLSAGMTQYRLLETTRAYGLEKLRESGEDGFYLARHDACLELVGDLPRETEPEELKNSAVRSLAEARLVGRTCAYSAT